MRRYTVLLAIVGLAVFSFIALKVQAQIPEPTPLPDVPSAESVQGFLSVVKVRQNGILEVTESISYDFGGEERHGIFRAIPLKYNGGRASISVRNIRVVDLDDIPYQYEVSDSGGYKFIKIGDPDVLISGIKEYRIRYEVHGAVEWGRDTDPIIWNVTGNDWDVPILEARSTLMLPSAEVKNQADFACYQGPFGSTEPCDMDLSPQPALPNDSVFTAGFSATRKLVSGEGLTFSIILPKGILTPPTLGERGLDLLLTYWPVFLPLLLFIFLFRRWWRTGRDPKGRGTIVAQYEPPAGLSPLETGVLMSNTVRPVYISAQIISLATRGFLKITPVEKKFFKSDDYTLEKLKDAGEGDSRLDQMLMAAIFSLFKDSVNLSDLKKTFSKSVEKMKKEVFEVLLQKGHYDRNPQKVFAAYLVAAFLLFFFSFFVAAWSPVLLVSCMVSAILVGIFGWIMPKVTPQGAIEKEHILGFKNYLQIAEKDRIEFHNAPEKNPELFERFLPYALALGVVDAWAKEFKDIHMEPPQWYGGSHSGPFMAAAIAHDMGRFSSVANSTAFAAGSSGSGGGGFSGGGAGGGGGGSW